MKYAIYKTPYGGLRAADYVDTLRACRYYLFAPYITKDRLPIVVNGAGGYTSFDADDPNFVEIVECSENEEPLTLEQNTLKTLIHLNLVGLTSKAIHMPVTTKDTTEVLNVYAIRLVTALITLRTRSKNSIGLKLLVTLEAINAELIRATAYMSPRNRPIPCWHLVSTKRTKW